MRIVFLPLMMVLAGPHLSLVHVQIESRSDPASVGDRDLQQRLKMILSQTEKRIQQVFGMTPDVVVKVEPSKDAFAFRIAPREGASSGRQSSVLVINSRVVQDCSEEDLRIAAARALYETVWPKFRRPYAPDSVLVDRLYQEGMTAYAAELIYPGSARWKYAAIPGTDGAERYQEQEKELAHEVRQALQTGANREFSDRLFAHDRVSASPWPIGSGRLLSYRVMKSLELVMDPKMIQLMDYREFRDRLPAQLELLEKGLGRMR